MPKYAAVLITAGLRDPSRSLAVRGRNRRWCTLAVCGLMFSAGLVMVTDAGIFIFQLMDNHAATYSALIIGCSEVSVANRIISGMLAAGTIMI